jgi:hypothetical protein
VGVRRRGRDGGGGDDGWCGSGVFVEDVRWRGGVRGIKRRGEGSAAESSSSSSLYPPLLLLLLPPPPPLPLPPQQKERKYLHEPMRPNCYASHKGNTHDAKIDTARCTWQKGTAGQAFGTAGCSGGEAVLIRLIKHSDLVDAALLQSEALATFRGFCKVCGWVLAGCVWELLIHPSPPTHPRPRVPVS